MAQSEELALKLIFIVDDDMDHLEMMSRRLLSAGYATETFHSGAKFLNRENIDAGDCVLLDNQMPGLSGLEVQAKLVQLGCTIPVLFMSGASPYADVVDAISQGAVNFLKKPVKLEDLMKEIEKAIDRRGS